MNKQIEALKLAREALKLNCSSQTESPATKAIAAIDEALSEQPAQQAQQAAIKTLEALGYTYHGAELWKPPLGKPAQQQEPFCYHDGHDIVGKEFADHSDVFPLYTSPPASKPWVGLTDEQFKKIKASLSHQEGWDGDGWDLALKEAIEAKLKEKNT